MLTDRSNAVNSQADGGARGGGHSRAGRYTVRRRMV